eukprot:3357476-Pyramimonas_sp.AAC.1
MRVSSAVAHSLGVSKAATAIRTGAPPSSWVSSMGVMGGPPLPPPQAPENRGVTAVLRRLWCPSVRPE